MPIAYTPPTHGKCHGCGQPTPWEMLDAKPFAHATAEQMMEAGLAGADFERYECQTCYGPGWSPM